MYDISPIHAFSDNFIWLMRARHGGRGVVVDPGDARPVLERLNAEGMELAAILVTHKHADHVGGIRELRAHYGDIPVYGPAHEPIPEITHRLSDGDRLVIEAVDPPETIRVSVPSDLPVIDTEELPLGQVLRNLIHNAVKHHPGPRGHVEVGFRDRSDRWEFTVRDDGAGVDPRYHQRIFEAFQTLQSWDEGHGTGIGLALVKKTVDGRGGEVWIESAGNPRRGSTFGFTWPKNAQGTGS